MPAFAGMTVDVSTACGRVFPLAFVGSLCDRRGSARLVGSGDVACRPWGLGPHRCCLQPSYAQASSLRAAGLGRVTSQPLALVAPTIARIARLRDGRPEAAELAGGYPLRIVRVAPLHDAGITHQRPKPLYGEFFTLWAKIQSHAC